MDIAVGLERHFFWPFQAARGEGGFCFGNVPSPGGDVFQGPFMSFLSQSIHPRPNLFRPITDQLELFLGGHPLETRPQHLEIIRQLGGTRCLLDLLLRRRRLLGLWAGQLGNLIPGFSGSDQTQARD